MFVIIYMLEKIFWHLREVHRNQGHNQLEQRGLVPRVPYTREGGL